MSVHRLVSCRKVGVAARYSTHSGKLHFIRWQSGGAAPKRSGALGKFLAGLTVTGAATGGVLAYGNYDPVFKNKVDQKLPGFASWVNKAADMWVDVTDYINPKPGEKKKTDYVYEYNQAKQRQNELKKKDKNQPSSKAPSTAKSGDKTGPEKSAKSGKAPVKDDRKESGGKVPGKDEKRESTTSKVKKTDVKKEQKEKPATKKDTVKPASESPKPEPSSSPTAVKTAPPTPAASGGPGATATPPGTTAQQSSSATSAPQEPDSTVSTPSQPKGKSEGKAERKESKETAPITGEQETVKSPPPKPTIADQLVVVLDRTHKKFNSDAYHVVDAQKSVITARKDLLLALGETATGADRDKAIAEAQTALTSAQQDLVTATVEYDSTHQQLQQLLARAPEEGCKAELTGPIVADMQLHEAEVGLGVLLVKAVTAGAELVQGSLDENKEKIKKDLETAMSLVSSSSGSEAKDDELSKKAESLENQLKATELEHARYVMLALEVQRRSLEQQTESKLQEVATEAEAKYQRQLIQEINKLADSYSSMLKQQLQLESESHAKEMSEALREQADKLASAWSERMELKLSEQQGFYQTELAKARARLYGLESMVDGITSAGEKTLQLQTLRNNCDILSSALDRANVDADATDRFTIGPELDALYKVAGEQPFITSVLNSIPSQAISGTGIQSETALRERFKKVRRVCKRVALVPETGGGLGLYAISYLQSLFTIRVPSWMSKLHSGKEPAELHTYELLDLADACVTKGDLIGAVYYLNYLQGEPKNIARDWLSDARLYLETRQAVELVQTFMFASSAIVNQ